MTAGRIFEEGCRVLTLDAFEFVLDNELKRAVRSQNFVSLVMLATEQNQVDAGGAAPLDERLAREIARLVSREVRETDLCARTDPGVVSLALLDADREGSLKVIERLLARLDYYHFPAPLTIAVGAACCPTDAVDLVSLRRAAAASPVVTRRRASGGQPAPER